MVRAPKHRYTKFAKISSVLRVIGVARRKACISYDRRRDKLGGGPDARRIIRGASGGPFQAPGQKSWLTRPQDPCTSLPPGSPSTILASRAHSGRHHPKPGGG